MPLAPSRISERAVLPHRAEGWAGGSLGVLHPSPPTGRWPPYPDSPGATCGNRLRYPETHPLGGEGRGEERG
eukprot:gene4808-biopygen17539